MSLPPPLSPVVPADVRSDVTRCAAERAGVIDVVIVIAFVLRGLQCVVAVVTGVYMWQSIRTHTPGATSCGPHAFGWGARAWVRNGTFTRSTREHWPGATWVSCGAPLIVPDEPGGPWATPGFPGAWTPGCAGVGDGSACWPPNG